MINCGPQQYALHACFYHMGHSARSNANQIQRHPDPNELVIEPDHADNQSNRLNNYTGWFLLILQARCIGADCRRCVINRVGTMPQHFLSAQQHKETETSFRVSSMESGGHVTVWQQDMMNKFLHSYASGLTAFVIFCSIIGLQYFVQCSS